jgi:hypothetical protein
LGTTVISSKRRAWAEPGGYVSRLSLCPERVIDQMHMVLLASYVLAVGAMSLLLRWYVGSVVD